MTSHDLMPFGKYAGQPLEKVIADVAYCHWLLDQEWFNEKYPDISEFLCGKSAPAEEELRIDHLEDELKSGMPPYFVRWWNRNYGNRLRKEKSDFLIPYLRIAREAWIAATSPEPPAPVPEGSDDLHISDAL